MLFAGGKFKLPSWMNDRVELLNTNFIKDGLGLEKKGNLNIPSLELSILETLYLCPSRISSCECYELMEFIGLIREKVMQELLENCNSIKVKRLFISFASIQKKHWLKYLDLSKINLGLGVRQIDKDGELYKEYNLILDKQIRNL